MNIKKGSEGGGGGIFTWIKLFNRKMRVLIIVISIILIIQHGKNDLLFF